MNIAMLFVDLKPEIEDEFEKNYRRTVVKSLKNIRREITQKFVSIFLTVKVMYYYSSCRCMSKQGFKRTS